MFETVRETIAEVCQMDKNEITEDTNITTDLGLNSFELINLIIAFEDALDIEIEDDELPDFKTVGDIVSYLEDIA